ncbi:permease prefix domain 1-containing protein [Clostridium vincentii]|uniref:Uncharacterized protein n=1 Tax=Clostridium vincentii TaxID=52704 RepID=A0A2T0BKN7_9CLOT|nr:permease prefix domain 1-containing protein [Clostridium vincentii]PRR84362.1 hypothetical protein CLVI_02880 [Clostridium vincentii]
MERLKKHVDSIFSRYKEDKQIRELKYEVLSNLEAKVEDLTSNGMDYNEAIKTAINSIDNIDYLINGNKEVYITKYKLEYLQMILIYLLVGWIITIPLSILRQGILINFILLISSIVTGIRYLSLRKKNGDFIHCKDFINLQFSLKIRKIAWSIWILFIIIYLVFITAIQFGSNVWFSRPVIIDGPYQFAILLISYLIPLISVIIPLYFSLAPKLIIKYEVGEDNEDKE